MQPGAASMHRESEPSLNPHSEDALSLFGAEAVGSKTSMSVPTSAPSSNVVDSALHDGSMGAALQDIPGAVSLARVIDAAPLRFVDGVALVQALSAAAQAKGGRKAAMPDLQGVFLKDSGEVVALGPTTGEPAARELARLLHRLVPSESTPPVGRLFIDRWTSGASTDLGEFTSELGYFARPNGRELLTSIYSRCAAVTAAPSPTLPAVAPIAPAAIAHIAAPPIPVAEPPRRAESHAVSWLKSHKRQMVLAAAMVVAAIAATGFAAWFWPSATTTAAQTQDSAQPAAEAEGTETSAAQRPKEVAPARKIAAVAPRTPAQRTTRDRSTSAGAVAVPDVAAASVAVPPAAPRVNVLPPAPTEELQSRAVPDLRIYSESDAGVQPPKLLSAEIPEWLIAGFPTKTNAVELIVGQRGDVERVRMLGPPQRIPDIMLLSRVKEWLFDPAVKDGTAVRYRMVLTWNVTP